METAAKTERDPVGLHGLIEDVFGLNIRGLITIRDSFMRPRAVAEAARRTDWADRYTPSIRVIFFILTLTSLLRFFWAPDDGAFVQSMAARIAEADAEGAVPDADRTEEVNRYLALYAGAIPFAWTIAQALGSLVTRVWGKGTDLVLRLRLHFAALIPSTTVAMLAMLALTGEWAVDERPSLIMTAASAVVVFITDTVTATRMGTATSRAGRLGRALAFALSAQLFGVIGMVAASVGASVLAF